MTHKSDDGHSAAKPATRLVHLGRDKTITGPFVNPPVVHASTVLFDSVDDMQHRRQRYSYGRQGTPTSEALESAITEIEGAAGCVLCPSGLAAATAALLSCLSAGDRLLIVDSVYGPVRHFADRSLERLGIETAILRSSPRRRHRGAVQRANDGRLCGSARLADVRDAGSRRPSPRVARKHGATVLFDNTWATPLFFRPLEHGADISIQAGTKYIGGHSDLMLGTVAASPAALPKLKEIHRTLGLHVGPDDIYARPARPADARCPARAAPEHRRSPLRPGWRHGRKSPGFSIRLSPATPATLCGSAT